MRNRLRELALLLDTEAWAKSLRLLLEVLLAGGATLYTLNPAWQQMWAAVFCVSMVLLVLWSMLAIALSHRYDLNYLVYNKETGVLFDKTMQIQNVALRRRTAHAMLRAVVEEAAGEDRQDVLRTTGHQIGRDFISHFRQQQMMKKGKQPGSEELLSTALQYDSSSGWGRFDLLHYAHDPKIRAEINVRNPFTVSSLSTVDVSGFLVAYLEGMCSEVFNRPFVANAPYGQTADSLNVLVEEQ